MTRLFFILLCILIVGKLNAQQTPGWEKAKADIISHQERLKYFLNQYGFESLKDFNFTKREEPYKKYSYEANNSLYKYIWEPDLILYTFYAKGPVLDSGDEFTFIISISYSKSQFSGKSGQLTNNYKYYGVAASIHEYKGKDLNAAVLNKCLFEYDNTNNFHVNGYYQFSKIDSIKYKRKEETNSASKSAQQYYVTLYGEAVREWGEYEYTNIAYMEAEYLMTIDATAGNWEITWFKRTGAEPKLTNVHENPNYPAVNLTKVAGLEASYQKYDKVNVATDQYRYLMDLCRLINSEKNKSQEDFTSIQLIGSLFSGEEGEKALKSLYQLNNTIDKYSLEIVETKVETSFGRGVKPDKENSIKIYYKLNRELSKEEWKASKASGASKSVLAVTKYPANGYITLTVGLKNVDGKLIIVASYINNELKLKNGNNSKHPLE